MSDPDVTNIKRGATFGLISLCGVPVSLLGLVAGLGNRGGDFGALGTLGVCCIALFGSFVCAVIGLIRKESPLWPAIVGGLLTFLPALLLVIGALTSLGYHLRS